MKTERSPEDLVRFVCVCTGDMYDMAETYVLRLHDMLKRNCPTPFSLSCVTDRARALPESIRQIDCSGWTELRRSGMRPTTLKLGLFNPAYLPHEDFVYLDLTLVIRADLGPLLDFMRRRPEPLVIVRDWLYDSYNSSVMRIRNRTLDFVYAAFVAGETYRQQTPGDQDFIRGVIQARRLDHLVALLPEGTVCSLKLAVRTSRRNPELSRQMIERAIIVKFHGSPKMHQFFDGPFRFKKYGIGHLRYLKWGLPFDVHALRRAWGEIR